jgi:hypothetical protein
LTTWLVVADAAVLAVAGAGYLLMARIRPASAKDMKSAFDLLDRSIGRYAPGLPAGYTWGEAVQQLKGSGVKADWEKVQRSLRSYEAYRYGGKEMPSEGKEEVVSLASKLRRTLGGNGTKGKSARTG